MKDELTNRQKRRRRRIRNQVLAYSILIIVVVLVLIVGYVGGKEAIRYIKNYNARVNQAIEEAESSVDIDPVVESETVQIQENIDSDVGQAEVEENSLDKLIVSLMNDMTLEEMVAGMFLVSPESITGVGIAVQASDGTKTAIMENPVGGLIYSTKNFKSEEQFTEMLTNTRSYAKYPIFTAVTVECGSNTTFGMEATPKASELTDVDSVRAAYGSIAGKLASYGVNMNMAPVAEIVSEDGNTSLQGRTFGSDATVAAPLVSTSVVAIQDAEISAVLQKFPGINSDTKSLEELQNSEFVIYDMAIQHGVDCIMVTNAKASVLTGDDTPSSLSSVVINDVLRNTLGFQGVVITDYLNDSAITEKYNSAQAAVAAIQAGADLIVEPKNYKEAYEGVLSAIADGTITEERIRESIYRIYRVKYKHVLDT